ncbi:spore germination protein [Neobacillus bataviensis LMG 21833]|uniref:Spore germination protein n=1 Tax=Neobacillus bataviensis LMG 21833 TaxID=1117379 RepID=K6CDD4_9BACI|nr:spore germination protein [Neobacillus bataviensis]EKN69130.1 spore germination protein [Neobacillus bataviensis LMG 21833]
MPFFQKYTREKKHQPLLQKQQKILSQKLISAELMENLAVIQDIFSDTPDLVIKNFLIKQTMNQASLVYLNGLSDKETINNDVLKPLLFEADLDKDFDVKVSLGSIKESNIWSVLEDTILEGCSVLFIDGQPVAYQLDTQGWPQRGIEDTSIESSLRGAHEGFVETGSTNIALIRRHIPNRELKIKEMKIGERGKTKLTIMYLADVANPEVLQELIDRINKLQIDCLLNTASLAEYIEDNPYSPFPQLFITERPDFAASEIFQGRIVIVVDRSPNVLIGPATFETFFKSMDDYSVRWMAASFLRLMRYFGFLVAIFLPATYISVISFHFEIIPLKLLLSVGASRERVPFPPFIEAIIMEITLEMLREAGIRLPAKIGQTVGIVGGIVIGQAAVEAGIVSNIMVIVVALTAIASFIIPNYDMGSAIRMLRFPMMIAASLFGFVGLTVGLMTLIVHFVALESLGTPYGSPMAPLRFTDWKDLFIRFPLWSIVKRPESTKPIQRKKANSRRPEGDKQ